jgi:hypothetical protein
MFIYFDLLATILDEPKSTKHWWNFSCCFWIQLRNVVPLFVSE